MMRNRILSKKTLGTVLTTLVLGAGTAALAGKASTAEPAPGAPKAVQDMECLVGHWKGTGRMTVGGQTADIKLDFHCKRTPGKWGVHCTTRMTGIPGMASYEETDLFGYDPGANRYHWFAVTNAGETHDHVADVPTGASADTVDWVYTGTQEGQPFKETVRMSFGPGAKTMQIRGETFLAGTSTSLFAGSLKK
jgi:hypothetical protein